MRAPGASVGLVTLLLAQAAVAADTEMPKGYEAAVVRALTVGNQIYVHDDAASRATDELVNRKILGTDQRLRGWLTDLAGGSDPDEVIVSFVGEDLREPVVLYMLHVSGDRPPEYAAVDPPAPLNKSQAARWKVRKASLDAIHKRKDTCSDSYNSVVLPADPKGDNLIHVYWLAATNESGVVVAGGHFRYDYSADGSKLVSERAFTRSCLTVKPTQEKGKPEAFVLTQLLDPTPTEIHVFLSLQQRMPIFVMTKAGVWSVEGTRIRFLDSGK